MSSTYQKKVIKKKHINSKEKFYCFTHLEEGVQIVDILI